MSSIYEREGRRILFVHIPKAGGSSVRKMIESQGWKIAEKDRPLPTRMSREIQVPDSKQSKHQHRALRDLWDRTCEYEFTIVRNPYDRIFSKAKQQAKEFGIEYPHPLGFINWVTDLFKNVIPKNGPGVDDNHFRSQFEFIGEGTDWYRIEDQIPELLSELQRRKIISPSTSLPRENVSLKDIPDIRVPWERFPNVLSEFLKFYEKDFEKFKYNKSYSTIYSNLL